MAGIWKEYKLTWDGVNLRKLHKQSN